MAEEAMANGAQTLFFLTQSLKHSAGNNRVRYETEINFFLQIIDVLGCQEGDENSIRVTLIDWAVLTCPDIAEGKDHCPKGQHGFDEILMDDSHPFGESGMWLTRTAFAIVLEEITKKFLPEELQTETPFENPASAALLDLAPPDDDPPLEDLIYHYYICPTKDHDAVRYEAEKINSSHKARGGAGPVRYSYSDSPFLVT